MFLFYITKLSTSSQGTTARWVPNFPDHFIELKCHPVAQILFIAWTWRNWLKSPFLNNRRKGNFWLRSYRHLIVAQAKCGEREFCKIAWANEFIVDEAVAFFFSKLLSLLIRVALLPVRYHLSSVCTWAQGSNRETNNGIPILYLLIPKITVVYTKQTHEQ